MTFGPVGTQMPGLYADLSQATAATINQLRQAFQIQKLLERDARGGTRYTEIVRSHFGVISPDARLQRPEYLGVVARRSISTPLRRRRARVLPVRVRRRVISRRWVLRLRVAMVFASLSQSMG